MPVSDLLWVVIPSIYELSLSWLSSSVVTRKVMSHRSSSSSLFTNTFIPLTTFIISVSIAVDQCHNPFMKSCSVFQALCLKHVIYVSEFPGGALTHLMPEIKTCWIRRGRKAHAGTFTSVLQSAVIVVSLVLCSLGCFQCFKMDPTLLWFFFWLILRFTYRPVKAM